MDHSPVSSPLLSSSPLNSPLNRTPVRKTNHSSVEPRHSKDANSGGSNTSSGSSTPRLPRVDLDTLYSASDSESVTSSQGIGTCKKQSSVPTFPDLDFLSEVVEGYDDMEEDTNKAKEMLVHLQNLVS